MIAGLLRLGGGMVTSTWTGRQAVPLLMSLEFFSLWRDARQAEAERDNATSKLTYLEKLESLGLSQDEFERIQRDDDAPGKLELFCMQLTEEDFEEQAGPNWKRVFGKLVGVPMLLLKREIFLLENMAASLKERGDSSGCPSPMYNFVGFGKGRLTDRWFLQYAQIDPEKVEAYFAKNA